MIVVPASEVSFLMICSKWQAQGEVEEVSNVKHILCKENTLESIKCLTSLI